jgi:4-phytase/acid phosphatase
MGFGFAQLNSLVAGRRQPQAGVMSLHGAFVVALAFAQLPAVPSALAQEGATQAPRGTLVKFVILSRHGVRSPIPSQSELSTWTASKWPTWHCPIPGNADRICGSGELTERGKALAGQMGHYYRTYLSSLLPVDQCPPAWELFFWADVTERTKDTGLSLLRGFRPSCDATKYFHTAQARTDRVFHPVTGTDGRCKLDAARAERDMIARAGGNLSTIVRGLENELATAQSTLQCCQQSLCQTAWSKTCRQHPPPPNTCTLTKTLPTCLVRHPESGTPTRVELGGALRVASTFAELLLLEYGNGFAPSDVGGGRITREQMTPVFRLHTTAFDLEQRTPYIAALQGSLLLRKILLALKNETDARAGTAPAGAKFVAYVGHDTNIANLGGMLELSWQQPGYQKDQTPPAGALTFELREEGSGIRNVYVSYVAQSLDDMRDLKGDHPTRTPVVVPNCSTAETGFPCRLDKLEALVNQKLDRNCSE